jgi:hypothetical protein
MKPITALSLLAATVALASCQSDRAPRELPADPAALWRRAWRAPGSTRTASSPPSQAGTFTTRTTDTNQLLASGTYINTSPTLVEINMTSLVRNTQSKVNCALVSQSQLNCTTAEGAQFSLARRA